MQRNRLFPRGRSRPLKKKRADLSQLVCKKKRVFVLLKKQVELFIKKNMGQKRLTAKDKRRIYYAKWEVESINEDKSNMLYRTITLNGFDELFMGYGRKAPNIFLDEVIFAGMENINQGHFKFEEEY